MKPLVYISTLALAACGVATGGADPVAIAVAARVTDSTIASQTMRLDDTFDVTCVDGGQEVDSAEQIADGLACVASRSATAYFSQVFMVEGGVNWGASGLVQDGVFVMIKVIGTNVSAVFVDRSGNYPPMTADLAALAPDGSFTANTTTVTVSSGCPSLFLRYTNAFAVSGRIDADGTVALDYCSFYHLQEASNRMRFTCNPDGQWNSLFHVHYDSIAPAYPATLSE